MSDEVLDISFPTKRAPTLVAKRELSAEELANVGPRGSVAPRVQQFRDSHHRIARAYAAGMRDAEVCIHTGYSLSRLSILKSDPAFQDLINVYRGEASEAMLEYADLMIANKIRGQVIIGETLEAVLDKGQPLSPGELRPILDLVSDLNDRTGNPKHTTATTVNITLGDRLEQSRKRAMLDITPSPAREPVT